MCLSVCATQQWNQLEEKLLSRGDLFCLKKQSGLRFLASLTLNCATFAARTFHFSYIVIVMIDRCIAVHGEFSLPFLCWHIVIASRT